MSQDEISALTANVAALNAKLDFMLGQQKKLTSKLDSLQDQFNQSKGALWFLKFAVGVGAAGASIWAIIHGVK